MKVSPDRQPMMPLQVEDSGEEKVHVRKQSDDMFGCLCDNVEQAVSRMNGSFQKMYLFHDELSKKNLPSATLRKLTTNSADLQADMSHLLIETERLVQKARLYAQPFERQCNTLKEMRQSNDTKQRKMDIAVKKLEIMSGRNEQLERQRVVGKWEQLFLKCSSYKEGYVGWRHTVEEYKMKMKNKESVAYLFRNLDTPESCSNVRSEAPLDEVLFDDENDFHFSDDQDDDNDGHDPYATPSSLEEELMFESHHGEDSMFDWVSKNSTAVQKSCDITIDDLHPVSYSALSDYNDGLPCNEESTQLPPGGNNENFNLDNTVQINVPHLPNVENTTPHLQRIVETPETADAYTSTANLDTFFQIRIMNPGWSRVNPLFCIINFGSHIKKGFCQSRNRCDLDASLECSDNSEVEDGEEKIAREKSEVEVEDGFCFDLECSSGDIFESESLKNTSVRIALQEKPSSSMLAFTSVNTSGLSIFPEHEIKKADEKDTFYNKLDLHFLQEDFKNARGQLEIICSVHQKKKQILFDKSTETMTYDELLHDIAMEEMKSRQERCRSACVETDEKPIYTEDKYNAINNELIAFKEGCANSVGCVIRADASTSPLLVHHNEDEIEFNEYDGGVQYFPRHSSCPAGRHVTFDNENIYATGKLLQRELTIPKMSAKSKRICEKLPDDFFARLNMFQEEKGKKHEHLKKEIMERRLERLEAEKKLCLPCGGTPSPNLPAAFMPSKNNLVYKVKARSYLHPSNHPSSILQLPDLRSITSPNKNLRGLRLEIAETAK